MAIAEVRVLIPDLDSSNRIFTDAQITLFLGIAQGSDLRAAALAVDAVASNEALLVKKMTTDDLHTDGPATADSLRKHAAALRSEAARIEASEMDGAFDLVFASGGIVDVPEGTPMPFLFDPFTRW